MRKIMIIYSIIVILSALGFSQTNGLISEIVDRDQRIVVYCDELMSSGNDDDLIITFWSVITFLVILGIAALPKFMLGDVVKLLLVTCLGGLQLLFLSGGLEAGSVVTTLRFDKNLFLFLWVCAVFSFIPVSVSSYLVSRTATQLQSSTDMRNESTKRPS